MGGIGAAVGTMFGGGSNNSSTTAQSANIMQTVTPAQIAAALAQSNTGLDNQAALLSAAQGQGGFGNQTDLFAQQQGVANMFNQQAQGLGPNPAQTQFNTNQGRAVADQRSLMAAQGGANQNVGLTQRNAAQSGANTMMQGAGAAATLQEQQKLAGQNALAGQLQSMQGVAQNQIGNQFNATTGFSQQAQNEQAMLLNAAGNMNSNLVSNQAGMNNNNMAMAMRNANTTDQAIGGIFNSIGGMSGMFNKGGPVNAKGSVRPHTPPHKMPEHIHAVHKMFYKGGRVKYAEGGEVQSGSDMAQGSMNKAFGFKPQPAVPSKSTSTSTNTLTPDQLQGGMDRAFGFDDGGVVQETPFQMTPEGAVAGAQIGNAPNTPAPVDLSESIGKGIGGGGKKDSGGGPESMMAGGAGDTDGGSSGGGSGGMMSMLPMLAMLAYKGGQVPAMVSPGEGYLSPEKVDQVKKGADPIKLAEKIPGKPKVKGDHAINDTKAKTLEEGGFVLPNTVMQAKNPAKAAHDFVLKHLSKSEGAKDEFKESLKKAIGSRKDK